MDFNTFKNKVNELFTKMEGEEFYGEWGIPYKEKAAFYHMRILSLLRKSPDVAAGHFLEKLEKIDPGEDISILKGIIKGLNEDLNDGILDPD